MTPEPLTPANTTVVLVDYAVGFANLLGSHDLTSHLHNVTGLAKAAKWYGTGLVVTNGESGKPSGPLYPELLDVLGDEPVIERATSFNAFLDKPFADAVRATGRENLVIGGISTEGCVLQTVLGGLREGYRVHIVVDASASLTVETHQTAVQRMVQAGAVPVTWFSLAAEFQLEPQFHDAPHRMRLIQENVPSMRMSARAYVNAVEQGKRTAG
ncbi:isochorismatase family protein [Streptomyces antimicrobicus]|uniref:Isochorismatase family protein n=1 Tax=Streptomyces antimicrobicus TaxID=2883108 RepID=A0ABS8B3T8_9ACTN|nr:isochorismatase family protein [Streptomyces antimicrobicus]MCB5179247.1 isochorismatase family protein [Streptomyces antimicrobicus]